MLRRQRLARKAAARAANTDMGLASTIVFFGVFPAVMATGLVLVQVVTALSP